MIGAGDPPRFPYLLVEVDAQEADDASALLFDLGAEGIEEREGVTIDRVEISPAEPSRLTAPMTGGRVVLVAAFASEEDAKRAAAELPAAWPRRVDHVVGDAWRDAWKKHFEPFVLCPGIVVCPPWREAGEAVDGAQAHDRVIVLEPGRAFGTGLHETTSLVAGVLAERRAALAGASVVDVGCGSGILSLVALAFGARHVDAVDVDPEAVAVTAENAARNGVADRITAEAGDLTAPATDRYAFVLANIEAKTLERLASALVARLADGGTLVLSGILAPSAAPRQWPALREAYGALAVETVQTRGEWLAAVLRR